MQYYLQNIELCWKRIDFFHKHDYSIKGEFKWFTRRCRVSKIYNIMQFQIQASSEIWWMIQVRKMPSIFEFPNYDFMRQFSAVFLLSILHLDKFLKHSIRV